MELLRLQIKRYFASAEARDALRGPRFFARAKKRGKKTRQRGMLLRPSLETPSRLEVNSHRRATARVGLPGAILPQLPVCRRFAGGSVCAPRAPGEIKRKRGARRPLFVVAGWVSKGKDTIESVLPFGASLPAFAAQRKQVGLARTKPHLARAKKMARLPAPVYGRNPFLYDKSISTSSMLSPSWSARSRA